MLKRYFWARLGLAPFGHAFSFRDDMSIIEDSSRSTLNALALLIATTPGSGVFGPACGFKERLCVCEQWWDGSLVSIE